MAVHRRPPSLRHRTLAAGALAALVLGGCSGTPEQPDNAAICRAYGANASHVEVLGKGTVLSILGTSPGPSGEHEGFLLKLTQDCDLMLRVEVNTDLTGAIPLHPGESVEVKGQYETDATGGVIHWTHRDPAGRHVAGYVLAAGKMYQ